MRWCAAPVPVAAQVPVRCRGELVDRVSRPPPSRGC